MKECKARAFDHLNRLHGFSKQSVQTHLVLNQRYVNHTNLLAEMMREWLTVGKSATIEWAEMKRRFAWEFNGMRLRELYFENLTTTALNCQSQVYKKIEEDFGPYDL